jgi:hypothetical protein
MQRQDSMTSRMARTLGLLAIASSLASAQDATTRVSVSSAGAEANTSCWLGGISSTGRHVVFSSGADNLVTGDINQAWDVFARDRDPDGNGIFDEGNDVTTRLSISSAGRQGNDWSIHGSISASGRHVVYDSLASNLVPNDKNGWWDVFTCDRDPDGNGIYDEGNDVTHLVSIDPSGKQGGGVGPTISADGRYVAFENFGIFVHDRDPDGNGIFDEGNGVTILMSISSGGLQANAECHNARISANGRHVAFESIASNLVAGDTNGVSDAFVHDRDPDGNGIFDEGFGATLRVSLDSSGVEGDDESHWPKLSGDGRYVLFDSKADDLVANDTNLAFDVFSRDRDPDGNGIFDEGNEVTKRMSVDAAGNDGNGNSYAGAISGTARYVAFYGGASNLVALDTNGEFDVFLLDRDPDGNGILDEGNSVTTRSSLDSCGFEGDGSSSNCEISADGRQVAFESAADNLVANDTLGHTDVFVNDRSLLPPGASWRNYGAGYPGTLGIPGLTSSANPVFGTTITLSLGNSSGASTLGVLLAGTKSASIPTGKGGTLLVAWSLLVPVALPPAGFSWPGTIPNDPALCGVAGFLQGLELDPGATYGLSFTAGLELDLGH